MEDLEEGRGTKLLWVCPGFGTCRGHRRYGNCEEHVLVKVVLVMVMKAMMKMMQTCGVFLFF